MLGELICDQELVTGRAGGDVEILITYEVAMRSPSLIRNARSCALSVRRIASA